MTMQKHVILRRLHVGKHTWHRTIDGRFTVKPTQWAPSNPNRPVAYEVCDTKNPGARQPVSRLEEGRNLIEATLELEAARQPVDVPTLLGALRPPDLDDRKPRDFDQLMADVDRQVAAMSPEERLKLTELAVKCELAWHARNLACERHELHQNEDALVLAEMAVQLGDPDASSLVARLKRAIAVAADPPAPEDVDGEPLAMMRGVERVAEVAAEWRRAVEQDLAHACAGPWAIATAARNLVRVIDKLELNDQPPNWDES